LTWRITIGGGDSKGRRNSKKKLKKERRRKALHLEKRRQGDQLESLKVQERELERTGRIKISLPLGHIGVPDIALGKRGREENGPWSTNRQKEEKTVSRKIKVKLKQGLNLNVWKTEKHLTSEERTPNISLHDMGEGGTLVFSPQKSGDDKSVSYTAQPERRIPGK